MNFRHVRTVTPASPTQFEATTSDDRPVYVRFQNDWLSIEVGRRGDSINALPGGGYLVFEELVARDDAIAWDDVLSEAASVDLDRRLNELEENERAFQTRWQKAFDGLRKREVAGRLLWTLSLADVLWTTPYLNRVGRFDFENALKDHCGAGIVAYTFTNPDSGNSVLTVLHASESRDPWSAMDLAVAGAKAFGGIQTGPTGGLGRGEAEGIRAGDSEQAFAYVAESLAQA